MLDLVAKRIPTERNYSMLRLRIKRFVPKAEGAKILVPAEGTALAGFDYDIDKLYLMRRQFKYKELDPSIINKIWNDFYTQYPRLKEILKNT